MEDFTFNNETQKWEFVDKNMESDYDIIMEPKYDNQGLIWSHWPKKVKKHK